MPEYTANSHKIGRVGDTNIVELIIYGDEHTWEYAIRYSETTGRYDFEEIDVLELDFGSEYAEQIAEELDAFVEKLLDEAEA